MKIQITKQLSQELSRLSKKGADYVPEHGEAVRILLQTFNFEVDEYRWSRDREIDITRTPHDKLQALLASFRKLKGIRGYKSASLDIETWLDSRDKTGTKKARNVKHYWLLARDFFAHQKHQRLYEQDESGAQRAYHLAALDYEPQRTYSYGTSPARVIFTLAYREFGFVRTTTIAHTLEDCTVIEGLRKAGLFLENASNREEYLLEYARWRSLAERIGLQCWARGQASDDLDGNPKRTGWWWSRNVVTLDPQGEAGKVVIDVFEEESDVKQEDRWYRTDSRSSSDRIDNAYWEKLRVEKNDDEDDEDVKEERVHDDEDDEGESSSPSAEEGGEIGEGVLEIPVYPMLAVFDMKRHLRLRVHVSQLEDYAFDPRLGERLILPPDVRDLVTVLLSHKAQFADVINGKSGGVCILCAGPPGTGKTLTAEVYSEIMRRPLYAVQTAQLGTTAGELENELRRVFARAQRWGAILLLDEADVYVRARGDDLDQNAIVGVFLRVLEYYQGIMFMTTNRVDMVDDAIASRCIARIDYKIPHPNDQKRIWRVLADSSGIELPDTTIEEIVATWSDLSGRDIKNLLKLSRMVTSAKNEPITKTTIEFVKRFKPTGAQEVYDTREGGSLTVRQKGVRSVRNA